MGLFRRKQETLNEQLLREAGLDPAQTLGDAAHRRRRARRSLRSRLAATGVPPTAPARRPAGVGRGRRGHGRPLSRATGRVHDDPERRRDRQRGERRRRSLAARRRRRAHVTRPIARSASARRATSGESGRSGSGGADPVPGRRQLEFSRTRRRRASCASTASRATRPSPPSSSGSASRSATASTSRPADRRRPLGGQGRPPL